MLILQPLDIILEIDVYRKPSCLQRLEGSIQSELCPEVSCSTGVYSHRQWCKDDSSNKKTSKLGNISMLFFLHLSLLLVLLKAHFLAPPVTENSLLHEVDRLNLSNERERRKIVWQLCFIRTKSSIYIKTLLTKCALCMAFQRAVWRACLLRWSVVDQSMTPPRLLNDSASLSGLPSSGSFRCSTTLVSRLFP